MENIIYRSFIYNALYTNYYWICDIKMYTVYGVPYVMTINYLINNCCNTIYIIMYNVMYVFYKIPGR